jgi:hypothetical protein
MDLEKGDSVVLHDKHSEFDGEVGEITQVSETMFGDATYSVRFDGGKEAGLPADALEPADGAAGESSDAGEGETASE